MLGASLLEVWGEDFKPREKMKVKKPKRKKTKHTAPLTNKEMKFELYNKDNELNDKDFEDIHLPRSSNTYSEQMPYGRQKPRVIEDDPDYLEFLEFKKKKRKPAIKKVTKEPSISMISEQERFNDLLLYIFTGFFLLMIYDNIYRLGKNSY